MRALCSPARSIDARTAASLGSWEYLTYTRVPPRKSMPQLMPCQASIETTPATLKSSEKAMKYHFLLRKSIFAFLKNSTLPEPFRKLIRTCHSERARLRAGEEPYVTLTLSCRPKELQTA